MLRITLLFVCTILAASCTFQAGPSIMKIRSLGEKIVMSEERDRSGHIDGLERTSVDETGKIQANVLIVHGMGWAQLATQRDRFGFDFIAAIEAAYDVHGTIKSITRLCPQFKKDGKRDELYPQGGLRVIAESNRPQFETDAPYTKVSIHNLACLDQIIVDLGSRGVVNVFRLFWDDAFYDAFEYRLLGYDDGIFNGQEKSDLQHRGYENINGLRASINSQVKNDLVTYGFSDATMYLGPAGQQIREGIRGGLCATINEATGQTQLFGKIREMHAANPGASNFVGVDITTHSLCTIEAAIKSAPLIIITKSLSSRAMFDVLTNDLQPELATKLGQISNEHLEVFMFANQIPLLGLGRLKKIVESTPPRVALLKKIRFIAVSEINDLLTYELVPYFEHLYFMRCQGISCNDANYYRERMADYRNNDSARRTYMKELGFEVIDVRARFAKKFIPFVSLVNPLTAHGGHINAEPISHLFLCGADAGQPRTSSCGMK